MLTTQVIFFFSYHERTKKKQTKYPNCVYIFFCLNEKVFQKQNKNSTEF